jgi:serine/threonine protein kinase
MDRRQLGKYDVLCRISTGGMSQIFLAAQHGMGGFNKLVVLKMILPDIVGEEDFVRMFLEEARITAAFNHPHIAQVFELDTSDDVLFMAMEFVQGCTLVEMARACRQAKEPIPIGFTLAAVRDTALALHYAHTFVDARGRRQIVIHRDVAEKNVMVTYEGVTKLLDFGIAKAMGRSGRTSAGMVKGTSGYMSPEQIRGEPLDHRSDIFSLGVVLHECLTGLRLFHGRNAEEGMMAALRADVAPPSKWNSLISADLDAVVLRALKKDREARFATALELARALERAAPGAIWHPEESGELVVRHFAERRAETRRVLEAAMGSESTGEVRVDTIIAKMKAAAERQSTDLSPQVPAAQPVPVGTQPGLAPYSPVEPEVKTTPSRGRPKAPMMSSPSPRPQPPPPTTFATLVPRTINLTPLPEDDEDDSYAKTIPAATLPAEIREMRSRLAWRARTPVVPEPVTDAGARHLLPPRPSTPTVRPPVREVTDETVSGLPGEGERGGPPSEPDLWAPPASRPRPYEPLRAAVPPPTPDFREDQGFSRNRTLMIGAVAIALAALIAALLALELLPGFGS